MPNFDDCFGLRCGLCTFELRAEDCVVALFPDGLQVQRISDWQRCRSCEHPNGIIPTFHEECYNKAGTPSSEKIAVTSCDFDPSPNESITDATAVSNGLLIHDSKTNPCLSFRLLATLPPELRLLVIKYVLQCWCTISTWSLNTSTRQTAEVDLSCRIWACFVKMHARYYIASLSNENANEQEGKPGGPRKTEKRVLIFDPASAQDLNAIYIARDAWGVRKIIFSCLDDKPDVTESPGVWWQILRISANNGRLITQNDGLKLRTLKYSSAGSEVDSSGTLWPFPPSPSLNFIFYPIRKAAGPVRMTSLIVNDAQVTGFSVYWNTEIAYLHAHKGGQENSFFLSAQLQEQGARWLYMPMGPSERLLEIWRRYGGFPNREALILVTNKNRTLVIAEHPRPGQESIYSYQPLARLLKKPTVLNLDLNDGPRGVGFSLPILPCNGTTNPPLPNPESEYPESLSTESFFYSYAALEDVSMIKFCRVADKITGMVVRYSDNAEVSLGWVRLDCLSTLERADSSGMWLLVLKDQFGFPQVTDIRLTLPLSDSHMYFSVQWCGKLEWWFSRRQCQLHYKGKKSLSTRP